jgi:predicted aspartyl protease
MSRSRHARALLAIAGLMLAVGAAARDLTPEVREHVFRATETVLLQGATVRVPMQGTDRRGYYRCPYFQVFVNGHGPFTFLYDTGSSYTMVSRRVAAAARTPVVFDRAGHRDVVQLAEVRLGAVTLKDIWAIQDDTFDVDGILGFPAFGSMNVQIDLAARRLTLNRDHMTLAGGVELPYAAPQNVPTVPVVIGGRAVQLLIDTGDDAYALELKADELGSAAVEHPPLAAMGVRNGSDIQSTRLTTLVDPVRLGALHAERAVAVVNDDLPVGDLGYAVLRQFSVLIDPGHKTVTFKPLFAGDRFTVDGPSTPGFEMSFDGSGKVSGVVPESEAAHAGMESGDDLVEVDGHAARSLSPRSWDRLMENKRPLHVRWMHAGKERSALLPVSEFR